MSTEGGKTLLQQAGSYGRAHKALMQVMLRHRFIDVCLLSLFLKK
jgi:hypothetical protein